MELSKEILGLVSDIHDSLRTRGETLSTAESLTAGGLSNAPTIATTHSSGPDPARCPY